MIEFCASSWCKDRWIRIFATSWLFGLIWGVNDFSIEETIIGGIRAELFCKNFVLKLTGYQGSWKLTYDSWELLVRLRDWSHLSLKKNRTMKDNQDSMVEVVLIFLFWLVLWLVLPNYEHTLVWYLEQGLDLDFFGSILAPLQSISKMCFNLDDQKRNWVLSITLFTNHPK